MAIAVMLLIGWSAIVGVFGRSVGTRSIAFGAHCWFLHPWFVALAWWRLYGFPWDPRLWVAFFVHDLGYIGAKNIDGPEGEEHPWLGATLMEVFDVRGWATTGARDWLPRALDAVYGPVARHGAYNWHQFAFYHSRTMARRYGRAPSRLAAADKLAIALTPAWLYLPMVRMTGEIGEYRRLHDEAHAGRGKYAADGGMRHGASDAEWYRNLREWSRGWAYANRLPAPEV